MHPVLFQIGPITIRTYGAVFVLAYCVFSWLLLAEAKRKDFYPDKMLDLAAVILVAGLAGARILHVLVNLQFYKENWIEIFMVWRGGLAFQGGFFAASVAGLVFILKNRMPLWQTADIVAPYVALAQSIGRIGCFLNGCCFGKVCANPSLGFIFAQGDTYRYPTQLYTAFSLLCIFIVLRLIQDRVTYRGSVFVTYIFLHSVQRLLIDPFRGDYVSSLLGLTVAQWISVWMVIIASLIVFHIKKAGDQGGRA
ncbi:MAG: prolipoprotein diacylglyceryl transferase [Candidatus Omnitrophota bacterium]